MSFKDSLVWTAIYPGTVVAQAAVLSAMVACHLITRVQQHAFARVAGNTLPRCRDEAWKLYKKNGEVWPVLLHAYGVEDQLGRSY